MKTGDKVKANPAITGLDEWIEGTIIDIEQNPFMGIVISIKDAHGQIFFGEERYFEPINNDITLNIMEINQITEKIIGCAIDVHKILGPGLLESAYEECLTFELQNAGLAVERQVPVPVIYKNIKLNCGYRIDLLVENTVIIELKTVDAFAPVHEAQILTYLKFANKHIGLLINFNVTVLKNGIKRYIY
jgi:GxxExxY protein